MFKNSEEDKQDSSYEPDFKLAYLSFQVQSVGAFFSGSKKSYHWVFSYKQTGANDGSLKDWQTVSVNLIDSCYSHKKTLTVNQKSVIEKEKIQNFGKKPFVLPSDALSGAIPVALRQVWD